MKSFKLVTALPFVLACNTIFADTKDDIVEQNKNAIAKNTNAIASNKESIEYLQDVLLDIPEDIPKPLRLTYCHGMDIIQWGGCPQLLGTEITLKVIYQPYPSSAIGTISSINLETVIDPGHEFPRINELDIYNYSLVNVSIDVGDDYIEIGFRNASSGRFSRAVENTYVLEFDKMASGKIGSATIDRSVTTLDLSDSDVRLVDNELFINVESLPFNPSSFVRINIGQ
ncbi:hypothetical protein BPLS_P4889 [Bathymodiolus platifrons methanotrophic gill symbiont]|uniref:hypothetical protein n=1 Tax=Bathymodiolus platifrons methanotrophic gill symbiont TaxID=113268 RepID=UPI0011CC04E4|nr:hypothetical protein [Bathymodiolus platifrons methanotrophic gill symbiont]TXK92831.1 hypothetical protein BMR10_17255 [Methylococcaceae bacterium CS4]TXK93319.1 hypothetical protein BMR11_17135 [Methylococcaceae bacterium CS5]TXL02673.1 hypothetical protein BMR08_17990 [Methylococcaceae bacterium CS2]TXL03992.1 hypothetical protein BMR07_13630 [Methylococcaceae bacterium CS1]TXL06854.1 hypothetical protein BMR09_07070 [Methylococcaceae bacterium CS3]